MLAQLLTVTVVLLRPSRSFSGRLPFKNHADCYDALIMIGASQERQTFYPNENQADMMLMVNAVSGEQVWPSESKEERGISFLIHSTERA